jgi:hypothetical protein
MKNITTYDYETDKICHPIGNNENYITLKIKSDIEMCIKEAEILII